MAQPVNFSGVWEETQREGFPPVLKAVGVADEMIAQVQAYKMKNTVEHDGTKFTVKAPLPNKEIHCVSVVLDGTEQEFIHPFTNALTKATFRWEGEKMISDMKINGKDGVSERYMEDGQMVMNFKIDGHFAELRMKKC